MHPVSEPIETNNVLVKTAYDGTQIRKYHINCMFLLIHLTKIMIYHFYLGLFKFGVFHSLIGE